MIRTLKPEQTPEISRVLCLYRPTRIHPWLERRVAGAPIGEGYDVHLLPKLKQLLLWDSYVKHYRANPRPVGYMLKTLYDFLEHQKAAPEVDLLVSEECSGQVPEVFGGWLRSVKISHHKDMARLSSAEIQELAGGGYDLAILLYPDAIGLGWKALDGAALRIAPGKALVLNGRKRAFWLDDPTRRALGIRRLLEKTYLPEVFMLTGMIAVGTVLAVWDDIRGIFRRREASVG